MSVPITKPIIGCVRMFKEYLIDYVRKHYDELMEKSNNNEDLKRRLSVIMGDYEVEMASIIEDYERNMTDIGIHK